MPVVERDRLLLLGSPGAGSGKTKRILVLEKKMKELEQCRS